MPSNGRPPPPRLSATFTSLVVEIETTAGLTRSTISANDSVSAGVPGLNWATAGAEYSAMPRPTRPAPTTATAASRRKSRPIVLVGPLFATTSGELGWVAMRKNLHFGEAGELLA
ncbi:protein of unknown function [Hyphomicrobium sp. 1Nfss2.1]